MKSKNTAQDKPMAQKEDTACDNCGNSLSDHPVVRYIGMDGKAKDCINCEPDNFTEAARFAGITASQGMQFHLFLRHLLGQGPAPGFLPAEPMAQQEEPAVSIPIESIGFMSAEYAAGLEANGMAISDDQNKRLGLPIAPLLEQEEPATAQWAREWHRVVETVLTVCGLSPALGADEALVAITEYLNPIAPLLGQDEPPEPLEFLGYDYKAPLSAYEIQFAKNAWTSYDDSGEQECGPDTHEERVLIAFSRGALTQALTSLAAAKSEIEELKLNTISLTAFSEVLEEYNKRKEELAAAQKEIAVLSTRLREEKEDNALLIKCETEANSNLSEANKEIANESSLVWEYKHKLSEALQTIVKLKGGNKMDREQLADHLKDVSGRDGHTNTCATSRAPAEEPGPCDCAEDWDRLTRTEETGGENEKA
jgi:hypothetical protein